MKLAFISDIHSNIYAFKKVIEKIEQIDIEKIFCCGDIVGYSTYPKECIKQVKKYDIVSVKGNHDYAVAENNPKGFNPMGVAGVKFNRKKITDDDLSFLKNLPEELFFEKDGKKFYMTHGSPRNHLMEYVHPWISDETLKNFSTIKKCDIMIFGHTHVPMKKQVDDTLFLNPGSVGQPRDGNPNSSFMVLNTDSLKAEWYRVPYEIDAAVESVKRTSLPEKIGNRLYQGR
ncbi:MAG: metallophosphoesterase [Candidatus Thermoplasmatota archaeon]